MNCIKIVLTGGPCGGKTKIIERIKKYVKENTDYNLMVLNESATELSNDLVRPQDVASAIDFQNTVFQRQLFKENEVKDILSYHHMDNNLILCDRGILDNKAYLNNHAEFDYLLEMHKKDEINLLDDYDLVIYLESVSLNDDLNYELGSNKARYEKRKDAKLIDAKTLSSWVGHRNLKVIHSKENFEDKVNETLDAVLSCLVKRKKERIVSYELNEIKSDLSVYNDDNSMDVYEENSYLDLSKNEMYDYVVSKRIYKGKESYLFTVSKLIGENKIILEDKKISYNDYLNLICLNQVKKIIKRNVLSFSNLGFKYNIIYYGDKKRIEFNINAKDNLPDNIVLSNKIDDINVYEENIDKKNLSMLL